VSLESDEIYSIQAETAGNIKREFTASATEIKPDWRFITRLPVMRGDKPADWRKINPVINC
jgi:hypothetical protein